MKLVNGMLEREQNLPNRDIDDSCFDSSELFAMEGLNSGVKLWMFVNPVKWELWRHPESKWPVSSDQVHAYGRAYGIYTPGLIDSTLFWPRTLDGKLVSAGLWCELRAPYLRHIPLFIQWLLFFIPVRWNDGNGSSKIQFGYRHHAGDYRLFKLCLPKSWVRYLVRSSTLKKMTRYYWEPEPNIDWLIAIDDKYIEELKK